MKTVLITSGPRGGGKTTYVEAFKGMHPHIPVVSRDKICLELLGSVVFDPYTGECEYVYEKMFGKLRQFLDGGDSGEIIILDCWNGSSGGRKELIRKAKDFGAHRVYCLQFFLPLDICIKWFMQKEHKFGHSESSVKHDYNLYYKTAQNIEEDGFDSIFPINPCQLRFENVPYI
jgi:predicted kinase